MFSPDRRYQRPFPQGWRVLPRFGRNPEVALSLSKPSIQMVCPSAMHALTFSRMLEAASQVG